MRGLWCQEPVRGFFDLCFLGQLTEKEVALEEEVGAGSGEETQERAGAQEGSRVRAYVGEEVAGSVPDEAGVPGVHSMPGKGVYT